MCSCTSCAATSCPRPKSLLPTFSTSASEILDNDPTFYHLSHTNNVPSDLETAAISSVIADLERAMANIDTSIEQLKAHREAQLSAIDAHLKDLEEERARLTLSSSRRRALLNPIRRLPFEILQHVFMDAIRFPTNYDFYRSDEIPREWYELDEEDHTLETLELVCKRWRASLLADSSLWSFINVIVSTPTLDEPIPRYVTRLERYLKRSRLSLISVCIRRCASFTLESLPGEIPQLLLPYANRIYELRLFLPHPLISGLSVLRGQLTALAFVHVVNTPFVETDGGSIDIFNECPRLKRFWTTDIASPGSLFLLPWQNIEFIESDHAYIDSLGEFPVATRPSGWCSVLEKAIILRKCHLELDRYDVEEHSTAPLNNPLVCHNLVVLTITCHFDYARHPLPQLLRKLTLPSLMTLRIFGHADNYDRAIKKSDAFTSVVDLIERSRCPLTTFEFGEGDILSKDFVRLFCTAPTIEEVKLVLVGSMHNLVMVTDALKILALPPDMSTVAPRLRTLMVSGKLQLEVVEFLDMIRCRWSKTPLKGVELFWYSSNKISLDMIQNEIDQLRNGLEEYCANGLHFSGNALQGSAFE